MNLPMFFSPPHFTAGAHVTDNVKGHIALDVDVVGGVDGYRLGSYGCFPRTIPSGDVLK